MNNNELVIICLILYDGHIFQNDIAGCAISIFTPPDTGLAPIFPNANSCRALNAVAGWQSWRNKSGIGNGRTD